jgi:hypothetical protein
MIRDKLFEIAEGQDVYVKTEYNGFYMGRVLRVTPTGKSSVKCYRRDGVEIPEVMRFGSDGVREGSNLSDRKWRRDRIDNDMKFQERTFDLVQKSRQSRVIFALDKLLEGRLIYRSASKDDILEMLSQLHSSLDEIGAAAQGIDAPIVEMNLDQLLESLKTRNELTL